MKTKYFGPDFVIAGAMKAGTTSIAEVLSQHPEINFSIPKEPGLLINHNYDNMPKGLAIPSNQPLEDYYLKLFRNNSDGLKGEASVAYFAAEESPLLVSQANPDVKIIIVLRDPIDRAYSAYNYLKSVFWEESKTFLDALQSELNGERDRYWPVLKLIYYSRYELHLERWHKHINPENILIIEFERLKHENEEFYEEIFEFLNIKSSTDIQTKKHSNQSVNIDSYWKKLIMKPFYTDNVLKTTVKKALPSEIRQKIRTNIGNSIAKFNTPFPPPSEAEMDILYRKLGGVNSILKEKYEFTAKYWKHL